MASRLREEFLELLEKDREFRYAVLGYLGMAEVLKRLELIAEELVRLREDFKEMRDEQARLGGELRRLAEEQVRLREDFGELRKEQVRLREDFRSLQREQVKLREDFNRMLSVLLKVEGRLGRVERTLEKLTLEVEEEAREVLRSRLREMGLEVKLGRLELPELELDIYGASSDVCVVGEATIRLGRRRVEELAEKIERLSATRPELLRPIVVAVIYAPTATREALEEAERRGIWVLRATGDLTKPPAVRSGPRAQGPSG